MSQPENFLYSRCPVVPTITGVAAQLGWLDQTLSTDPAITPLLQQQQGEHLAVDPAPHRERYWLRNSGNLKAIWARSEGAASRVIGLSWITTPNRVLTLPGSGIRTAADLKGRRLAVVGHANALVDAGRAAALRTYEIALASAGLTLDDVELVNVAVEKPYGDFKSSSGRDANALWTLRRVGQREFVTPILRGEADAVAVRGTFAVELGTIFGTHTVFDLADHLDPAGQSSDAPPYTLVASQALIDEQPEYLNRILVDLLKASQWSRENPQDTLRLLGNDLGHIAETIDATYGPQIHQGIGLDLSETSIAGLRAHKDFLLRHRFIKHDVDLQDWIDPQPLQRALATLANETRQA